MLSLVSDYPHICLLPDLLQQLLLTLLLLSWSAHSHAVRLKEPLPLHTARVPTITLPSRGFGCCTPKTTSSPRHHLRDPPPPQVRRYVYVRRRCALAALMPSPATSFAELCGAIVAAVARSLASETPPLRNPRVSGSTFRTGGAVAFLAFARPFPTPMCFSALPTETTPSFSHKRVRF